MNEKYMIPGIAVGVLLLLGVIMLVVVSRMRMRQTVPGKPSAEDSQSKLAQGMAIGISIGTGTGVALGVALKNIALGIALLGTGICIALGVAFGRSLDRDGK